MWLSNMAKFQMNWNNKKANWIDLLKLSCIINWIDSYHVFNNIV